jgi:hypothetical protein
MFGGYGFEPAHHRPFHQITVRPLVTSLVLFRTVWKPNPCWTHFLPPLPPLPPQLSLPLVAHYRQRSRPPILSSLLWQMGLTQKCVTIFHFCDIFQLNSLQSIHVEHDIFNRNCRSFGSVWDCSKFDKRAEFQRVLGAVDLPYIVWPAGSLRSCQIDRNLALPRNETEMLLIDIGSDMLLKLARRLHFHPNLNFLNLRGNAKGDIAMRALAESLSLLTSLTTLNLSSTLPDIVADHLLTQFASTFL